jgi:hypothetical protein
LRTRPPRPIHSRWRHENSRRLAWQCSAILQHSRAMSRGYRSAVGAFTSPPRLPRGVAGPPMLLLAAATPTLASPTSRKLCCDPPWLNRRPRQLQFRNRENQFIGRICACCVVAASGAAAYAVAAPITSPPLGSFHSSGSPRSMDRIWVTVRSLSKRPALLHELCHCAARAHNVHIHLSSCLTSIRRIHPRHASHAQRPSATSPNVSYRWSSLDGQRAREATRWEVGPAAA